MKPPRTLHLTNFYHSQSGGISAFYRALMAHANAAGREMRLVVPGEQSGFETSGAQIIYTVQSPRAPWIDARYRLLLPIGRPGREIAQILRSEQPDILEVADKYSLPYVSGMVRKGIIRGVRRPTEIATSHERLDDNIRAHWRIGPLGSLFARLYMRYLYFAQFDHHVANSEYTAAELIPASRGHTTPRSISICPMGVDTQLFAPAPATPHTDKRLLYTGRVAAEKNIELLLRALELLEPEYTLDIIGDGPLRDWLLRESRARTPGRVRLHGFIADRREYVHRLQQADAFVHPNPREPFGIGPLEAMACGVPVLVPNSGGVLSYANENNAWLYQPAPQALAAAVRSALADDVCRRSKLACARATAESHDWSLIAERYFGLIDDLHRQDLSQRIATNGRWASARARPWSRMRKSHNEARS
jgi:alpha-1,6-mannosyltransferase